MCTVQYGNMHLYIYIIIFYRYLTGYDIEVWERDMSVNLGTRQRDHEVCELATYVAL